MWSATRTERRAALLRLLREDPSYCLERPALGPYDVVHFLYELRLTPETEAKLNDLARRTRKATDELLGEAVDYLVAYNEWFERKVRKSMVAAEENQTVSDEEVAAWIERRQRR